MYCRSKARILGVTYTSYCSHISIDTSVCCVFEQTRQCCFTTEHLTRLYEIPRELRLNFLGGPAYKHDIQGTGMFSRLLKMVEINLLIIAGFCDFKCYRKAGKIQVL